jgi:hypothetical protein
MGWTAQKHAIRNKHNHAGIAFVCAMHNTRRMPSYDEMTTAEAMARLNVKEPSTISRWVKDGKLAPSRRLGEGPRARFMFWRSDVDALAAEIAADLRARAAALEEGAA